MKTLKVLFATGIFSLTLAITGCGGGANEDAHKDDPTPGGEATEMETDENGDPVMGEEYANENK